VYEDVTPEERDISDEEATMTQQSAMLDEEVGSLKAEIHTYKQQIQDFEMMQSDWLTEKEALEGVLVQLRSEVKEMEASLNMVETQRVSAVLSFLFFHGMLFTLYTNYMEKGNTWTFHYHSITYVQKYYTYFCK